MLTLDKPRPVTNFAINKISNKINGDCTIFNFEGSTTKCKHNHNIYVFDRTKTLLYQLLNQSSNEIRICNNNFLFENIIFAKAQNVWMGETSDHMKDFVSVFGGKKNMFLIYSNC